MPRPSELWTLSDDATLRRFAFTETAPQIAKRLERTLSSVKYRAHVLGVVFVAHAESSAWTDAAVDQLKTLWAAGDSAAVIARTLGAPHTRNGVIGKVGRLGLPKRLDPQMEESRRRKSKKVKPPKKAKAIPPSVLVHDEAAPVRDAAPTAAQKARTVWAANADPAMIPAALDRYAAAALATRSSGPAVPLVDLEWRQCRWPLTDASGRHGFCGAPRTTSAAEGSGVRWYCDPHGLASIDKKFHRHRAAQILAHAHGQPVPALSMIPRQYANDPAIDFLLASLKVA